VAIWDRFKTSPAENVAAPPYGAGENQLTIDQISDTFRVVMAGVREVGNIASTAASSLGTLASQNAANVNITGGTIQGAKIEDSANVDAASVKRGSIDPARLPANLSINSAGAVDAAAIKSGLLNPARIPADIGISSLAAIDAAALKSGLVPLARIPNATNSQKSSTASFAYMPSGHLIQGGFATTGASGYAAVSFPESFPGAVAAFVVSANSTAHIETVYSSLTANGVTVRTLDSFGDPITGIPVRWVAFGY
jgi:hypothetical protein